VEELATVAPCDLYAAYRGGAAYQRSGYELALFTAWHIAVFTLQAKAGKLKPWREIRETFTRVDAPAQVKKDWRSVQAERQQQMTMFKKHQAQRTRPVGKHGR
jgi:hypothetical protein